MLNLLTLLAPDPKRRATQSFASTLQHLGALGLFFLAILDSSPIPTFGGPDILTAILAASHRNPWYEYAAVATVGSVIGAFSRSESHEGPDRPTCTASSEIGSWMPFSAFFTNGEPVLSPPLQRCHFH